MGYHWNWGIFWEMSPEGTGTYLDMIIQGLRMTLITAALAWAIAFIMGSAIGVLRTLPGRAAPLLANAWIELFRNMPLLVQLFLWYFVFPEVLPAAWGIWLKQLPGAAFLTSVIGIGFFMSARVAVQVSSGIEALPQGQRAAATALGLTPVQTYRYVLLPMAYRIVLPPLTSELLNTVKNTSVALTIGLAELTARARAVQLPAWNEALGLPRPWDQQWSLRMQQILAYETDLLDYGDIFDGSAEIERKVDELKLEAMEELKRIEDMGGAVVAVESGYMKQRLVESNTARLEAIERGEQIVVGVNKYLETEASPLTGGIDSIMTVSEDAERDQLERLKSWREQRDPKAVANALADLKRAATSGTNIMPPSIACAKAGVTTGEWGWTLREAFGEYRAPTGVGNAMRNDVDGLDDIRADVDRVSVKLGRRLTFLVGKPGLDGHSNGAEQIAVRARDAGMQVVYEGIRLTPEEIVDAAREQKAHVIGLSVLSGSHLPLVADVVARMKAAGMTMPLVVGGIIPPEDALALEKSGVAAVYTPKDFELNRIMSDVVRIVEQKNGLTNV